MRVKIIIIVDNPTAYCGDKNYANIYEIVNFQKNISSKNYSGPLFTQVKSSKSDPTELEEDT